MNHTIEEMKSEDWKQVSNIYADGIKTKIEPFSQKYQLGKIGIAAMFKNAD